MRERECETGESIRDSCAALDRLQQGVEGVMADLLDAARAVQWEQGIEDPAEAFDYTVSFLSGAYRALALAARDATIAAMVTPES